MRKLLLLSANAALLATGLQVSTVEDNCYDSINGDECYYKVEWARAEGVRLHPDWYADVAEPKGFYDFQEYLWKLGKPGCQKPCRAPSGVNPIWTSFNHTPSDVSSALPSNTLELQDALNNTKVWGRIGPCRHERSLLAPSLPHDACKRYECLKCRSGKCMLDTLLVAPRSWRDARRAQQKRAGQPCREPSGGQVSNRVSDDDKPLVSFVWTVHNKPYMVAKAVMEVFRTAHEVPSAEFVLYDDGSTEDMSVLSLLVQVLKYEFGTRMQTLQSSSGHAEGYTLANTYALRQAKGKYAVLLNTDVFPLPGWLGMLLGTIQTFPGAGLVGPMMISPAGTVKEVGGTVFQHGVPAVRGRPEVVPSNLLFLHATTASYISAACVMFDRELFLGLGLFDPQFAPAYFEDTDAALSMREAGYLAVVQPLSVVIHAEGSSYTSAEKEEQMRVNQQRFSAKHKSALDLHCPPPDSCSGPRGLERAMAYDTFARQGAQVLLMDSMIPEPDKDSGSLRLRELMRLIVDMGYGLSFEPLVETSRSKYVLPLLAMGVNVMMPGTLFEMALELGSRLRQGASMPACPWDAIVMCRRAVFLKKFALARALCPNTPILYDTVDLSYVRERRSVDVALSTGDDSQVYLMDQFWDLKTTPKEKLESLVEQGERLEVSFMKSSDFVLVVSTEEFKNASEKVGADKVRLLSNIYPDPDRSSGVAAVDGRQGGLFVGNACHTPNIDATKFIMREIFGPDTHAKYPKGFMHFVFSRTSLCPGLFGQVLEEARNHPLVTLHLDVTDEELFDIHTKVQFFLGALRVGAGVKGKLCQALLYGLPIIGSQAATEGMHMVDGMDFLEAATPEEYRVQIANLSGNTTLWQKLQKNGFDLVQNHFGRGVARATLEELFGKLRMTPRVGLANGGSRHAATAAFSCPLLPSGLGANSSGPKDALLFLKPRNEATNALTESTDDCLYAPNSRHLALYPTRKLSDNLFGDD